MDTGFWKHRLDQVVQICLIGYLFVFSIPHTAALRSILLSLAVAATVASAVITRSNPFRRTAFDYVIAAWTIVVMLKVVFSIDPEYSMKFFTSEFIKQLAVFYLITSVIRSPRQVDILIITIIGSGVLLSLTGIVGYWEGNLTRNFRATSYLASPGRAAFYVSLIFPVIWGLFLYQIKNKYRVIWLVPAMIAHLVFMVVTMARGAWVSIIASIILMTALRSRVQLIIVLILLILLVWFLPGKVIDRAESIFRFDELKGTVTYGDRYWMWLSAAQMIQDRPLFGAGYGIKIFQRLYPEYIDSRSSGFVFDNAHNQFIQIAVETGLTGLLVFTGLLSQSVLVIIRKMRRIENLVARGYLLGIAGSIFVFVLYSLSAVRYENEIGLLFWYLLACLVSISPSGDRTGDKTSASP